jgi:enoyl-[acyl-carrier-protein] reductase (NADH)
MKEKQIHQLECYQCVYIFKNMLVKLLPYAAVIVRHSIITMKLYLASTRAVPNYSLILKQKFKRQNKF